MDLKKITSEPLERFIQIQTILEYSKSYVGYNNNLLQKDLANFTTEHLNYSFPENTFLMGELELYLPIDINDEDTRHLLDFLLNQYEHVLNQNAQRILKDIAIDLGYGVSTIYHPSYFTSILIYTDKDSKTGVIGMLTEVLNLDSYNLIDYEEMEKLGKVYGGF